MIEPIPYFYESINRNATLIKPKKPLFYWINFIYPDSPVSGKEEGNIYLLREMDSNEAIEKWIKRNFNQIFKNEQKLVKQQSAESGNQTNQRFRQ